METKEKIFDLEEIRAALEECTAEEDGNGNITKQLYLGTVFDCLPSGKYYTSWACSNVTEEELEQDELWFEQAQEELEQIGCFLENGEGDPCDLSIVQIQEEI